MCGEYTKRYRKIHKVQRIIEWCHDNVPPIKEGALTQFRQAVAEDCYHADPVIAYHVYYVRYKSRFAKWKLGNVPEWYVKMKRIEQG